jgi:hypothetical protein
MQCLAQAQQPMVDAILKTVAGRRGIKPLKAVKTPDSLGVPLAAGHFGEVYKVNIPELHKEVIIKVAKTGDDDRGVVVPTFSSDVREGTCVPPTLMTCDCARASQPPTCAM